MTIDTNTHEDARHPLGDNNQGEKSTLRQIPNGENFSSRTEYIGDRMVNATYSIRRSESGPRYEKTTLFDFRNVPEDQLVLLAMYGVKVKVQAILRAITPEEMLDPATLSEVDVQADIVNGQRPKGDPFANSIRVIAKRMGLTEDAAVEALTEAVGRMPRGA